MADCSAQAEQDDLHRRWLPREIFADIGIADAAPPTAAAAVEDAVANITGVFAAVKRHPPPPPGILSYPQPQVCGLQAMACVPPYAYATGPPPPCTWPLFYLPLQWQMQVAPPNGGTAAFLGCPRYHYQALPPPPAKRRLGGTGVFLPRAGAGHQHLQHKAAVATASPAPAKDGRLPDKRKKKKKQRKEQQERQGKKEDEQKSHQQEDDDAAAEVLLALPQEWTLTEMDR